MYDHDKDGILNIRETQKVLKCLGLRLSEEQVESLKFYDRMGDILFQALSLASKVSSDHHGYSVSFNEYLQLVSFQRRKEPDQQDLMQVFRQVLQAAQ